MVRRLLPMPVILTGAGSDSGTGNAFICMPLWHAVACADRTSVIKGNVASTVAMQRVRRNSAGQSMVTLSDVAVLHAAHRPRCAFGDVGGDATQYTRDSQAATNAGVEPSDEGKGYSPSMKRLVSQESLPGPMQRIAIRPTSMQKSVRPSCMAGQNP